MEWHVSVSNLFYIVKESFASIGFVKSPRPCSHFFFYCCWLPYLTRVWWIESVISCHCLTGSRVISKEAWLDCEMVIGLLCWFREPCFNPCQYFLSIIPLTDSLNHIQLIFLIENYPSKVYTVVKNDYWYYCYQMNQFSKNFLLAYTYLTQN